MSIPKLLSSLLPAAALAGLSAVSLGAQATIPRDDGTSSGSIRAVWLSAAGLTSAAVFASFLHGSQAAPSAGTPAAALPNPVGTAVTVPASNDVHHDVSHDTATHDVSHGTTTPEVHHDTPVPDVHHDTTTHDVDHATPAPDVHHDTVHDVPTTTPEPSSLALLATGLVGLVPLARRRRNG